MSSEVSIAPAINGIFDTADGQRLYFGEWPGEAPEMVFCGGLISTHLAAGPLARALHGRMGLIAPDLRGRGNSSKPGPGHYGIDRHANDLIALIDHMGINRAIVGGFALGATVACAVAAKAPERVRGLVLLDGGVHTPASFKALAENADRAATTIMAHAQKSYASQEEYVAAIRAQPEFGGLDDQACEEMARYDMRRNGSGGLVSKCKPTGPLEDIWDLSQPSSQRLEEVRCPTLAVVPSNPGAAGQLSGMDNAHVEFLLSKIPQASVVRLDGVDHAGMLSSAAGTAAVADVLAKFVSAYR